IRLRQHRHPGPRHRRHHLRRTAGCVRLRHRQQTRPRRGCEHRLRERRVRHRLLLRHGELRHRRGVGRLAVVPAARRHRHLRRRRTAESAPPRRRSRRRGGRKQALMAPSQPGSPQSQPGSPQSRPDSSQPQPAPHGARLSPTEQRNPASSGLDEPDTLGVLQVLNSQDRAVIDAVAAALPQLAALVDLAAERMRRGGRVHYFGGGISGRLGVLGASELLPTFNLEPGRVLGHIAGGQEALVNAVENAEDSASDGRAIGAELGPDDVAIGIAASGSTPYVGGALEAAGRAGAHTVLISNNPYASLAGRADDHIVLDTGPEAITGSTRLKAGTAQKLTLNGFSTALMVALGRTWDNLMVSVVATNA